jgi:hypothetical protein
MSLYKYLSQFNGFLNILTGLSLHTLDLAICMPTAHKYQSPYLTKLIVKVQKYLDFISKGIKSLHPGPALQLLMWIWNF